MSLRTALIAAATLALPAALAAQTATKPMAAKPKPAHETQAQLQKEATVSLTAATAAAAKAVPAGKITSHELERENGKLIYSFDIKTAGKSGTDEVNVDAMTGAIVSQEHESPAAEKKEAAADAKKKPTKSGGI